MGKITQEMLDELKNEETLTIKRKKEILLLIDSKVDDVFKYIIKKTKGKFNWYAYSNDIEYGNGNGSSGGEFDIREYGEYISFKGEYAFKYNTINSSAFPFFEGFPTYLITLENHEEEIDKLLEKYYSVCLSEVAKKLQKREAEEIKKAEVISTIKAKLTKEELKYIKFK
jgi:hypothetical protein